ncbi:MAG: ABC transporter substrate-binding protein [Candidatus Geothermincolia bacterium]
MTYLMETPKAGPRRARVFLACAILLTVLAVTLAAGCGGADKKARVVRVGFLRNDLHQLAYYVAREKGFFTEQGLDVREGGAFNAGPEEMSAFSAGDLDIGYVGTAPILTFAGQEMADVKIVAQANMVGSSILVRPGLEATDITALKGHTIAVPGISTVQDFLLHMALEKAGVDPSEVKIIVVKPPEMLPALAGAQVDAAVVWEPYPSMAVAQSAGRILEKSQKIWPHHPCCMVVADARFIEKNPDAVRRFVAAHAKATDYIKQNGLEAADMAHLFTGQPTDVARAAMKNIEFGYTPDVKKITQYVEFMEQAGVIKGKNPGSFSRGLVDSSFIPGGGS